MIEDNARTPGSNGPAKVTALPGGKDQGKGEH